MKPTKKTIVWEKIEQCMIKSKKKESQRPGTLHPKQQNFDFLQGTQISKEIAVFILKTSLTADELKCQIFKLVS